MSKKHPLKKYQTTIVMIVLALVMGGVAWHEYKNAQTEKVEERRAAMILGWEDESEYHSARLERDNEAIEVVREDGIWRVTSPVNDLGNDFNIEAWFGDMATEKGQKIDAKKGADGNPLWAEYGLEKNLKKLTVKKTDGTTAVLEFAEHSAYDGSYFLKYNNEVWIGEKPWVSVLNKELKHLRERDIYRHSEDPVGAFFDYPYGKTNDFTLKKTEEDTWVFEDHKDLPVSTKDVKDWFGALRKVSVVDFFDHLSEKEIEKTYNQKNALVKITLHLPGDKKEMWTVSRFTKKDDRQRYYIRLNDSTTVFEADKAFVERFMGSRNYFRDGRPQMAVELEKVTSIKYSDPENSGVVLEKSDSGKWSLKTGVKGYQFDSEQFETWLTSFNKLEAQVFLKKSQLKGMKKPALTLSFQIKDQEKPLEFQFGKDFSSDKTFARLNPLVYTYVNGRGAFGVQKSVVDSLSLDKLLKKDEIKQSSNESESP